MSQLNSVVLELLFYVSRKSVQYGPHCSNDQSATELLKFLGLYCQKINDTAVCVDESCTGGTGGSGVMLESWEPGSSLCQQGSKPSGETDSLKSSDSKRTKAGVVHPYLRTCLEHSRFTQSPATAEGASSSS